MLPPPADEYKLPEADCAPMVEELYMLASAADEYKLPWTLCTTLPCADPGIAMLEGIMRSVQVQNV